MQTDAYVSDSVNNTLASQVLANFQAFLNDQKALWKLYYAPGAVHQQQTQEDHAYQWPKQAVTNTFVTMEHVTGLALATHSSVPSPTESTPKSFLTLLASSDPKNSTQAQFRKLLSQMACLLYTSDAADE